MPYFVRVADAAMVSGAMAATLGIRPVMAVMCAVVAAASLSILVSPLRGLRNLPERGAEVATPPDAPVRPEERAGRQRG